MASRLNTKFVLILVSSLFGLLITVAVLWKVLGRTDSAEYTRRAEALFEVYKTSVHQQYPGYPIDTEPHVASDGSQDAKLFVQMIAPVYDPPAEVSEEANAKLREAFQNVNRALQADPDNAAACDLYLRIVQQLVIDDTSRATDYANRYLSVLDQRASAMSGADEAVVPLLNYLHDICGRGGNWPVLFDRSEKLLNLYSESLPARMYRALAVAEDPGGFAQTQRSTALTDTEAVLRERPDSILARYAKARLLLYQAQQTADAGRLDRNREARDLTGQAYRLVAELVEQPREDEPAAELWAWNAYLSVSALSQGKLRMVAQRKLEDHRAAALAVIDQANLESQIVQAANLMMQLNWKGEIDQASGVYLTQGTTWAMDLLTQASQTHPRNLTYRTAIGRLLLQRGQEDQAMDQFADLADAEVKGNFRQVSAAYFARLESHYQTARILLLQAAQTPQVQARQRENLIRQAREIYNTHRAEFGDNSAYTLLLETQFALLEGDLPEALALSDNALAVTGRSPDALMLAYEANQRFGETGTAIQLLKAYVDRRAVDLQARSELAELMLTDGLQRQDSQTILAAFQHARVVNQFAGDWWVAARVRALALGAASQYEQALATVEEPTFASDLRTDADMLTRVIAWNTILDRRDRVFELRRMLLEIDPNDTANLAALYRGQPDGSARQAVLDQARRAGTEPAVLDAIERQDWVALSTTRDDLQTLLARATAAMALRAYDQAERIVDQAMDMYPDNNQLLLTRMELDHRQGNPDAAEELVQRLVQENQDQADGHTWKAWQAMLSRDVRTARRAIDAAQRRRTSSWTLTTEGYVYLMEGDNIRAVNAFKDAVELGGVGPNTALAIRGRAIAHQAVAEANNDDPTQLEQSIDQWRVLRRNQLLTNVVQAMAYAEAEESFGDLQRAIDIRREIRVLSAALDGNRRELAMLYVRNNQPEEARQEVASLIEDFGRVGPIVTTQVMVEHELGNTEAARAALDQYVASLGDQPTVEELIQQEQLLRTIGDDAEADQVLARIQENEDPTLRRGSRMEAQRLINQGRYAEAEPLLMSLLRQFPDDPVLAQYTLMTQYRLELIDRVRESLTVMDPSLPTHALGTALLAINDNKPDEAVTILTDLLDRLPEDVVDLTAEQRNQKAQLLELRAQAHAMRFDTARRGQASTNADASRILDQAVADAQAAAALTRNNSSLMFLLGKLYTASNRQNDAINALTNSVALSPAQDQARMLLIELLIANQRLSEAERYARDGAELEPENPNWLRGLAALDSRQGRWAQAASHYRQVIDLQDAPTASDILPAADAYLRAEQPQAARDLYNAYPAYFEINLTTQALAGRILANTGAREQGMSRFVTFVNAVPDPEFNWLRQRLQDIRITTDLDMALAVLEQTRDLPTGWAITLRGDLLMTGGQGQQALSVLQQGDAPSADDTAAYTLHHSNLAILLSQANQPQRAREAYEAALSVAPNDPASLNNLAYLLLEQLDDPEAALPYAERAWEQVNQANPSVGDTLGWAYYRLGRYEQAFEVLERVGANDDLSPETLLHVGLAYAAMDEPTAGSRLRRALSAGRAQGDQTVVRQAQQALSELNN